MLVWCPWSRKMDLFNILLQSGLITSLIVFYLIVFKKRQPKKGHYSNKGWNYPLKYLYALYAVKRWKGKRRATANEAPNPDLTGGWDNLCVKAVASDGTALMLGVRRLCDKIQLAEVTVYLQLSDGTRFMLPRHPDTAVGVWEPSHDDSWDAGGLKIQVLQPKLRLRIFYDGDLTNIDRKITQHVRFSFIWSSGSYTHHHPEDWSIQLAAEALATEPWRDGNWPGILNRWNESSWVQWGCVQGRVESYDSRGTPEARVWVRARGYKERSWAPRGYQGLRRSVSVMVTGTDGTMVQLRAVSHRDVLTHVVAGCVRFPDYEVETIAWTDFSLPDFGEYVGGVPDIYTINVATNKGRTVKVILRMSNDVGYLLSGAPYQYRVFYQTVTATVDEYQGTGLLELGYEPEEIRMPCVQLSPARRLRFRSMEEVGRDDVTYCLHLSAAAAECPALVGGKGASLALLSSVQQEEDYRVPPGFCVTTLALEKQLEMNPNLKAAILEIEAAGGNYEEAVFREKCNKTVELFTSTVVVPEVKEELLVHLRELRKEAIEENLGPTVRFAVRSSGVGEDGECLSAAGQNDTILGCVTDDDVLNALLKCWASMYAFTSAHYRRQNGSPCACAGGVVVQALVRARSAGVMFTRHPTRGGSHVLITANYGLGESVVSGTVEPDTIVVSECTSGELVISELAVGGKSHRVQEEEAGGGTARVPVPASERAVPCLASREALALAALARGQRSLWGGHRDLEWAIAHNVIYLLQARPITSLERWSEEELLHEFDDPIMSDDTLTTFANTGEVMPKPLSPLTLDFVIKPLVLNMYEIMEFKKPPEDWHVFKRGCGLTHYRVYLEPYNLYYRRVSSKVDLAVKMSDMAVHGHVSADAATLAVATHIHPPRALNKLSMYQYLLKCLLTAAWVEKRSAKKITKTSFDTSSGEPETILKNIEAAFEDIMIFHKNHMITTSASSATQIISMSILLEGGEDFSPAHCSSVGAMLGGCWTVSAEVGAAAGRVARAVAAAAAAAAGEGAGGIPPADRLVWLRKHAPHLYGEVIAFLDAHGHRALMEFDLATKPWALEPEKFIEFLLTMDVTEDDTPPKVELSQLIASLTTPKKSSTRKILSWILPMCRRMVVYRESTKASVILHIHKLRVALLEVGKQMVKKWMLPDRDLVFFFRLHELKNYLATRDPVLLRKAQLRRQYRSQWSRLKFPEISRGWPRPRPPASPSPSPSSPSPSLCGTAVCAGEVVGRAAVITDLDEIGQLKQGDILITHSTDIGWSPYFPMLSGIVTELGGLISHGAVIAREYGLPCIVGAADATEMFSTGDIVRLSGAAGTLQKVLPESETGHTYEE